MASPIVRNLQALDLEEKILNGAAFLTLVGLFLPWISGEWMGGESRLHTGFGFFTSFLGFATFLIVATVLAITVVPACGGPVLVKKRHRDLVRLCLAAQSSILVISMLSVLTRITFEFPRLEIRFGVYVSLIGSVVMALYAFLRLQEFRRQQSQAVFHHPEAVAPKPAEEQENFANPIPPPPPPPAPKAEDHRLFP